MERIRKCPSCDVEIIYSSIYKKKRAEDQKSICRKCSNSSRKGDKHPMFGKQSPFKDKNHTDHSRDLISKNHADVSGEKNPMFGKGGMNGKSHSDDTKLKISQGNKNKNVTIDNANNVTVGHVCLNIEQNNILKFLDAWVHEDYRRCGIYRKLWDARWEYVYENYKGYKVYAWCKPTSLPLYLEKNFSTGEIVTYVETII